VWIFSRYIISEFLKRFFVFLFILVILFIGIDLLSRIWSINTSLSNIANYYFFRAPNMAVQVIPVSVLLATLLLFSYLSKHNELVALYTGGRSLLRIASPMFLIITFICTFSFYFSDYVLPITNFQAQKIWMVDILGRGGEFFDTLHQKKAWFRDRGKMYNISSYDSASNTASGVNVYEFSDSFDMAKHLSAKQAVYDQKTKLWILKDVKETDFTSGRAVSALLPEKEVLLGTTPNELKKIEANTDYLPIDMLRKYIKELESAGISHMKYSVELNKRYSLAVAGFIMCIIGLPFAVRQHRRGGVALNVGIGFALVFVYWIMFSVLLSLGISGRIWPPASAWGANVLFLILSLLFIRKIKK